MKELKERLKALAQYQHPDIMPEKELKQLVDIACLVFDVPIAHVSFIDEEYQYIQISSGIGKAKVSLRDTFCQYVLNTPDQIMVVPDAEKDERFQNNPFVCNTPNIRFYAGAPLVSPDKHVVGTLVIIDNKPKNLTKAQISVLQKLAEKVMGYLNTKKTLEEQKQEIAASVQQLIKLTENVPSTIFQLRKTANGMYKYDFVSMGTYTLPKEIDLEEYKNNPFKGFELIVHLNDLPNFIASLKESALTLKPWEFKFQLATNTPQYYQVKAIPEKQDNADIVWYGMFEETTNDVLYEKAMEKMAFDISHILRKPVTNLLGMVDLLEQEQNLSAKQLSEYVTYIKIISKELSKYTEELNNMYHHTWQEMYMKK